MVRHLSRLCGIFAAVLLLAAVLVVSQLVFVRYVLGESAIWQHEFVTFSLIAATFFGSPYLLLQRGHVNVDLLPIYLGRRGRMGLALVASGVSLAFCLVIAWTGAEWWLEAWTNGWHAETVWAPPLWIPYLAMPLGIGLLALQYVADILALLSGRAMPFGPAESERP
ncbi:MAG: TRAP transporter small permease [Kiloniellaceae bacterium]